MFPEYYEIFGAKSKLQPVEDYPAASLLRKQWKEVIEKNKKIYAGLTDEELKQLDKWVRNHTQNTFGPVREVDKELVFEVAFDAVHRSPRHKSGFALRFPRIHRIRWDKPAQEADHMQALENLLQ